MWVIDQIKFELSLEAKFTKLRPSYLDIMRQELIEKTIMLRKTEGCGKRISNMRLIDSKKEARALNLQQLLMTGYCEEY